MGTGKCGTKSGDDVRRSSFHTALKEREERFKNKNVRYFYVCSGGYHCLDNAIDRAIVDGSAEASSRNTDGCRAGIGEASSVCCCGTDGVHSAA